MVRLKKKNVVFADTPLIEGLYVAKGGSMLQIRLKDSQVVMSAVDTFEDLVRCGKTLVERYRTVERLKEKMAKGEYCTRMSEHTFNKRQGEQSQALVSDLHLKWYKAMTVVEEEVKKERPKRVGIKLKKVATG